MCTIKAAIAALDRYGGFDPKRSRTISRELINTGTIPMGAPGMAQVLSVEEFMLFFEALAFDPLLREARDAAHRAKFLVPGGVTIPDDAPAAIPRSAHTALLAYADLALGSGDDQRAVSKLQFEFVSTWPEITIRNGDGCGRFVEPGANPQTWQSRGHRRSTSISGGAFIDTLRALFTR